MRTFDPPTRLESSSDPFFGRYSIPVGETVIRVNGHFTTVPYPWLGDLDGLTDGEDYFLGGHIYAVTDEIAAELTTAGYTVGAVIEEPPDDGGGDDGGETDQFTGFGEGPFGSGPFGS